MSKTPSTTKDSETNTPTGSGGAPPAAAPPPAPPPPTETLTAEEQFQADRKVFRAAFIKNYDWDEKKLTSEQEREIVTHPFWTDPGKLRIAVTPTEPEPVPEEKK